MERINVLICAGTGCTSSNSGLIEAEFERWVSEVGIEDEVKIIKTGALVCVKRVQLLRFIQIRCSIVR